MSYKKLILIGIGTMLLGWVIVFLMVLNIIGSSFFRSFISYGLSVCGLFMGYIGILKGKQINKDRPENIYPEENKQQNQI